MTDLLPMQVADRLIEAGEKAQAVGSNADLDFTAIRILATATDEAALLQPVEETGDVRIAGNHACGNLTAEQAIGCATQDTEDVVLVGRQVVFPEELSRASREQVHGAGEFDEYGLLGTREGFDVAWRGSRHSIKMVVTTDKCQKKSQLQCREADIWCGGKIQNERVVSTGVSGMLGTRVLKELVSRGGALDHRD